MVEEYFKVFDPLRGKYEPAENYCGDFEVEEFEEKFGDGYRCPACSTERLRRSKDPSELCHCSNKICGMVFYLCDQILMVEQAEMKKRLVAWNDAVITSCDNLRRELRGGSVNAL